MTRTPLLSIGSAPGHFTWLLVMLLAMLLTDAALHLHPLAPIVSHLLLGGIMVLTIYPLRRHRGFMYLGGAFATFTFAALWVSRFSISPILHEVALVTGFIFFMHAALVILLSLLQKSRISTDELAGAISAYLLIGIAGAFIFAGIEIGAPGSIRSALASPDVMDTGGRQAFDTYLYFSFTCLTTLGFGDLIPASPLTRVLAYLKAVIGQIYLTILVARLVGLHLTQSRPH